MAGIHDRLKGVRSLYQGSAAGPPPPTSGLRSPSSTGLKTSPRIAQLCPWVTAESNRYISSSSSICLMTSVAEGILAIGA